MLFYKLSQLQFFAYVKVHAVITIVMGVVIFCSPTDDIATAAITTI